MKLSKESNGSWVVSQILSVNGKEPVSLNGSQQHRQMSKQISNKSKKKKSKKNIVSRTLQKIKSRYRGEQGFLRRLFLVAMGGSGTDYASLEARAESLEPFIEYVEHSKEAYQHLRKTARFRWEPVENEKFLTITKQLGTKIRVRSENLPYILTRGPVEAILEDAQLMHPKGHIADILIVRRNSVGVEFLTSQDLDSSGWRIFGGKHSMEEIEWSHNTGSKPIEKISLGNHDVRILNQSKKGEWIELVLDSESKDLRSKQLLFDGRHMEWESISQADFVGPLKDGKSGRQVISRKVQSGGEC